MIDSKYLLDEDGIYKPNIPIEHREDEYQESGFKSLLKMQEQHFWYKGRHRFLLAATDRFLSQSNPIPYSAIDFGGGCGGWVAYLGQARPTKFDPLALADSSLVALSAAKEVLPAQSLRYQVDLMQLSMNNQWDAAFLLDVIEHLPDDVAALRQAREALKPGGFLFVTAPAFPQFWSYNDDMAQHLRRYRRSDFKKLAEKSGLTLCDARYFMFYLSPLYLLSRMKSTYATLTPIQKTELIIKQHQVPSKLVNSLLSGIFAAETPFGHWLRFPWGTSILGVFKKT